jgi:hypothetical protein
MSLVQHLRRTGLPNLPGRKVCPFKECASIKSKAIYHFACFIRRIFNGEDLHKLLPITNATSFSFWYEFAGKQTNQINKVATIR